MQQDLESLRDKAMRAFFQSNKERLSRPAPELYPLIMGFLHAINWREPLIVAALCTYAALLLLAVLTRRIWTAQFVLFLAVCGSVYAASYINAAARPRWRELGFTQNYFDERGVFMSAVFSGPLLLIAFVQMLMAFFSSASLLITVKRMELKQNRLKSAAASAAAAGPAAADAAAAVADAAPLTRADAKKRR